MFTRRLVVSSNLRRVVIYEVNVYILVLGQFRFFRSVTVFGFSSVFFKSVRFSVFLNRGFRFFKTKHSFSLLSCARTYRPQELLCDSERLERDRNEKWLARVVEPEWIETASTIVRVRIKLNKFRNSNNTLDVLIYPLRYLGHAGFGHVVNPNPNTHAPPSAVGPRQWAAEPSIMSLKFGNLLPSPDLPLYKNVTNLALSTSPNYFENCWTITRPTKVERDSCLLKNECTIGLNC